MNTLLNAIASQNGTTPYGLLKNKTFTIDGRTKSGWSEEQLLPNGTANRVPWVIISEPMVVMHLKDKTSLPGILARAVGSAVSRYPVALLIPCHRVIGTDGRLHGYAGGTDKKLWLLKMENNRF